MELTTREAAERLNVNQSRVRALVASGGLRARRVGDRWLVDADSVDRQATLKRSRATGRSMSQRIAWAASDLADGGAAEWLAANERSRLRQRLASTANTAVVQRWLAGRADKVARYRVGAADLEALLSTEDVVRTGVSAAAAYRLGLGTGGNGDVYVASEVEQRLVREFFLIPSGSGNLTLRVVEHNWHLASARVIDDERVAARLIVGVDLADDTDVRTQSAGRTLISAVLAEQAER